MNNSIAIITARGGSKRIPRKNIKTFLGQPIIQYSINAALQTGSFDDVMVSTDDEEIAAVALSCGASVPFLRSAQTANDHATTAEVLMEVLADYGKAGRSFTYCCCLYPTAPFVNAKKLALAHQMLVENGVDSVVPVTRFSFPIWRSFKMAGNKVSFNWPEFAVKRSQDLPPAFHDCGQFYFLNVEAFLTSGKLFMENTMGLEVPESEVQDIDNEEDWKLAEIKFQNMQFHYEQSESN